MKKANKLQRSKKNNKENERQHSLEAKNSHNLMNINHKSNEELMLKDQEKDNLNSNDKIIEEFDKLEHFKKVEERCRSASKGKFARVKKNNDMDKCQAQKSGNKTKESRGRKKLRSNLDKNCDSFNNCESNKENRDSKYLKDENECSAEKLRERSMSNNSEKSCFENNHDKLSKNKHNKLNLMKKTDKECKDAKDVCLNDDENCYKRSKSACSENERGCEEKDEWINDNDCDIPCNTC